MSRTGLFDSHAHMDSDYFTDDRDALLTQLQEELERLTWEGAKVRFPDGVPEKHQKTIRHELETVRELMGCNR